MQPELQQHKKEVLDKYGKIFALKNIDKLTSKIYEESSLYENNHTLKDIKEFFSISNFSIKKIVPITHKSFKGTLNNEANVYFYNNNYSNVFDVNTKYNYRYFNRVLKNKTLLKDDFKDFIIRIFNRFF